MLFNKKNKEEDKCSNCRSGIKEDYSFFPYCGNVLFDPEQRAREFGMLGKSDSFDDSMAKQKIAESNLTITDKMISSLVNTLMKSFENGMESGKLGANNMPRNIKIKIGMQNPATQQRRAPKHDFSMGKISDEQLKKMSGLPKSPAKTKFKRLGGKLVYELDAPGIESIRDIFISKLESGYEVKALAKNKVYVNSLQVNLPITSFSLDKDKLFVEFSQEQM